MCKQPCEWKFSKSLAHFSRKPNEFIRSINVFSRLDDFHKQTSLKKSSGSGGGEHVVYSADVAKQGWQRRWAFDLKRWLPRFQTFLILSIHTMPPALAQQVPTSEDLAYRGHATMANYDGVWKSWRNFFKSTENFWEISAQRDTGWWRLYTLGVGLKVLN